MFIFRTTQKYTDNEQNVPNITSTELYSESSKYDTFRILPAALLKHYLGPTCLTCPWVAQCSSLLSNDGISFLQEAVLFLLALKHAKKVRKDLKKAYQNSHQVTYTLKATDNFKESFKVQFPSISTIGPIGVPTTSFLRPQAPIQNAQGSDATLLLNLKNAPCELKKNRIYQKSARKKWKNDEKIYVT